MSPVEDFRESLAEYRRVDAVRHIADGFVRRVPVDVADGLGNAASVYEPSVPLNREADDIRYPCVPSSPRKSRRFRQRGGHDPRIQEINSRFKEPRGRPAVEGVCLLL